MSAIKGRIALIVVGLSLGGCVSTQTQGQNFMTAYQTGDYAVASQEVSKLAEKNSDTQHRLLWALQDMTVKYWSGNHQGALAAAVKAEEMVEGYEARAVASARNIGSKLGSLLTNDEAKAYQGSVSDKIFLNTYKALIHLAMGNIENARVELRRAAQRRKEALEANAKAIEAASKEAAAKNVDSNATFNSPQYQEVMARHYGEVEKLPFYSDFANPMQVFLEGLVEGTRLGDTSAQENATRLFGTLAGMIDSSTARDYAVWVQLGSRPRRVHILYEQGMAPTKESESINLPLFITGRLTMIHFAFPYFSFNNCSSGGLQVACGASKKNVELLASVDSIQARELKLQLKTIMMSQMVSAGIKAVAENQIAEHNVYLGLAASLINTITTKADTRSWSTLPKQYLFASVPAESNRVILQNSLCSEDITLPEGRRDVLLHVRASGRQLTVFAIEL